MRMENKNTNNYILRTFEAKPLNILNPRRHKGGGGQSDPPLDFFGLKFLFLDRLPKALAQLFFVSRDIF